MIAKRANIDTHFEHPIVDHAINALGEAMVHPAANSLAHQSLIRELIKVFQSDIAHEVSDYAALAIQSGKSPLRLPISATDGPPDRFVNQVATEVWTIGVRRTSGRNRGIGQLLKALCAGDGQIQKPETILGVAGLPRKLNVLASIYQAQLRRDFRRHQSLRTANSRRHAL